MGRYCSSMCLYNSTADGQADSHAPFGIRGKRAVILPAEYVRKCGRINSFSMVNNVKSDVSLVIRNVQLHWLCALGMNQCIFQKINQDLLNLASFSSMAYF